MSAAFCANNGRHSKFAALVIVIVTAITFFEVMPQKTSWQTSIKNEGEEHVIAVVDFGLVQKEEKEDSSSLTNAKTREGEEQEHQQEEYDEDKLKPPSRHKQNKHRNTILLVDDESDICFVYQTVLNDAGYKCDSYTDPVKAIQEFRPDYYDLVMLDIKMPILNGFELCRRIREHDKSVKVIFVTASLVFYDDFRSKQYSDLYNIHYIEKPIGNEDLVKRINSIIKNTA